MRALVHRDTQGVLSCARKYGVDVKRRTDSLQRSYEAWNKNQYRLPGLVYFVAAALHSSSTSSEVFKRATRPVVKTEPMRRSRVSGGGFLGAQPKGGSLT